MEQEPEDVPVALVWSVVAGAAVLFVYACSTMTQLAVFSTLFIYSGGALLVGGLIGFLFGIPKSKTALAEEKVKSTEDAVKKEKRSWTHNANLEPDSWKLNRFRDSGAA